MHACMHARIDVYVSAGTTAKKAGNDTLSLRSGATNIYRIEQYAGACVIA